MRSSRFLSRFARAAGLRTAVAALLVLPFVACGGGGGGSSTPTQPTGPTQAQVTVTYADVTWADPGNLSTFNYSIQFTITIHETAGIGIKGNFLRVDFYDAAAGGGVLLGRQEAGGDVLGHMAGQGTETENLVVGFNNPSSRSFVITLNATDDRGNTLTNSQTFNLVGFTG